MTDEMFTIAPPLSSMSGTAARDRAKAVVVESAREVLLVRLEKGLGRRAADVIDDDVDPAEVLHRPLGEVCECLGLGGVAGDDERLAPELAHFFGYGLELVDAARGQDQVGPVFGEC